MSDVLGSGATDAAPEPDRTDAPADGGLSDGLDGAVVGGDPSMPSAAAKRRRRGTRGGRGRNRTRVNGPGAEASVDDDDDQPELPDRPIEGKVQSPEVAERVLVRRPRIGDTRPALPPDVLEPPAKTGKPA